MVLSNLFSKNRIDLSDKKASDTICLVVKKFQSK